MACYYMYLLKAYSLSWLVDFYAIATVFQSYNGSQLTYSHYSLAGLDLLS